MKTLNKKLRNLLLTFLGVLMITGCAVKVALTSSYFQNQNKVGVLYTIDTIGFYKMGSQGLLDMAMTAGNKFQEPIRVVGGNFDPTMKIKGFYQGIFDSKGKSLKEIEFDYDEQTMSKFEKPSSSDKNYHKYDLTSLKEKGIDELLMVNVRYGLAVSYYGFIETGYFGHCTINSEIIDLTDNSVIYKDISAINEKIKGKWETPPDYEPLKNSISVAVDKAIQLENGKLNK